MAEEFENWKQRSGRAGGEAGVGLEQMWLVMVSAVLGILIAEPIEMRVQEWERDLSIIFHVWQICLAITTWMRSQDDF